MLPSHFKHSEAKRRLPCLYELVYEGVISHGDTPLDVSTQSKERVHSPAKSNGVAGAGFVVDLFSRPLFR